MQKRENSDLQLQREEERVARSAQEASTTSKKKISSNLRSEEETAVQSSSVLTERSSGDTVHVEGGEVPEDGVDVSTNADESYDSFESMGLREELLRGIFAYGFEKPSAIQSRAVKPIMMGRDTIAQAQSGTGKTGAFSIGALERVDLGIDQCQVLILNPIRELARQTARVISDLTQYMDGLKVHCCVGGTKIGAELGVLRSGCHVVVGTPGRVLDMIGRQALDVRDLKILVIDEADEMLGQGFLDQVKEVFTILPSSVQVGLFSATLPSEILDVTKRFMRDPVQILVKRDQLTLEGIKQYYVAIDREEHKLGTLVDFYQSIQSSVCMIYCSTKRKVIWLQERLEEQGFAVNVIHGEMEQDQREEVMRGFHMGAFRILITTDLLARGIDVHDVSLVINFELPPNRENYIHRIGRGGRYGKKGVAINLITPRDIRYMRDIEHFYHTEIEELPTEIVEKL